LTARQEVLRDKLLQGVSLFKTVEALRAYIQENEKIASGTHDQRLLGLIREQNLELDKEYTKLLEVRTKIDKCISSLDDPELRAILTMRYLGHKTTFVIAERLNYGRNSINRKHKAALDMIIDKGADKYLDY
jgi:DNA-directed RNA polymerase specialized sigma subunit